MRRCCALVIACACAVPPQPRADVRGLARPPVRGDVGIVAPSDPAGAWVLRNDTEAVLYAPSREGFSVHFEWRTAHGWVSSPVFVPSLCGCTPSRTDQALEPHESLELRACDAALPAGTYSAVVDYLDATAANELRAGRTARAHRLRTEFDMVGLSRAESDAFVAALAETDALACLDAHSLGGLAQRFAWFGDRAAVRRVAAVEAPSVAQDIALARSLWLLPDAVEMWARAEAEGSSPRARAAAIALWTNRTCWDNPTAPPCGHILADWSRTLASGASLAPEILDALADGPKTWPEDLPAILIRRVADASPDVLARLAHAIEATPEAMRRSVAATVRAALRERRRRTTTAAERADLEGSIERIECWTPRPGYACIGFLPSLAPVWDRPDHTPTPACESRRHGLELMLSAFADVGDLRLEARTARDEPGPTFASPGVLAPPDEVDRIRFCE